MLNIIINLSETKSQHIDSITVRFCELTYNIKTEVIHKSLRSNHRFFITFLFLALSRELLMTKTDLCLNPKFKSKVCINNLPLFFKLFIDYLIQQNKVLIQNSKLDNNHPKLKTSIVGKGLLMEIFLVKFAEYLNRNNNSSITVIKEDEALKLGRLIYQSYYAVCDNYKQGDHTKLEDLGKHLEFIHKFINYK